MTIIMTLASNFFFLLFVFEKKLYFTGHFSHFWYF